MKQTFDVLFVGAGPSSLAGALHLKRLMKATPALKDMTVAVLEKSPNPGDHILSGASMDTRALAELIPDFAAHMDKLGPKMTKEKLCYMTAKSAIPFPFIPSEMSNHGCYLVSLAEVTRWLSTLCEKEGVEIYTGEPADDILWGEKGNVRGVIVKEKGRNKEGAKKSNYLEPTIVEAKLTIIGEGSRGHLTKRIVNKLGLLNGRTPQGHAVGLKEIWEVSEDAFSAGTIMHSMGYPLGLSTFGGSFMYHIKDRQVALGLVISLDYKDPNMRPFELFQNWKEHPAIKKVLKGGRLISYGAKTLAEGGWYSMPKPYGNGFMLIGECAGFLNSIRLKGIHLSMKSGMLSAETAFEALKKNDLTEKTLKNYGTAVENSWIKKEMWGARNFHQGFHKGVIMGMINTVIQKITGGKGLADKQQVPDDYLCTKKKAQIAQNAERTFTPDGDISFDRLTCVFASGTKHEEDQPSHLKIDDLSICNGKCAEEYGNPCQWFCPAQVYEFVENEAGKRVLELNPTNCVHCKTCDIKDPYGIITWVPPEGGGGPNYKGM